MSAARACLRGSSPGAWAGVAGPPRPTHTPWGPSLGSLRALRAAPAQPAPGPRAGARRGRGAAGRVALLFLQDSGMLATWPRPLPEPPGRAGGLEGGGAGGHSPRSAALGEAPSLQAPCFPCWGFDPETLAPGVRCVCGQVHLLDNRLVLRWEAGAHQEAGWKPGLPTRLRKDFPGQGLFPPAPGGLLSQEVASDGWGSRRGACVSRGASHTHTGASGLCAQPSAP